MAATLTGMQPAFKTESCIQPLPIERRDMLNCSFCTPAMRAKANKIAGAIGCIFEADSLEYDAGNKRYKLDSTQRFARVKVTVKPKGSVKEMVKWMNVSKTTPFYGQPACGIGTAFAVSKRTVLTAAHCVYEENDEGDREIHLTRKIVFNYRLIGSSSIPTTLPENRVYGMKNAWASYPYEDGEYKSRLSDWAWVELDRDIEGIEPIPCAELNPADREMSISGYPMGMPLKHSHGLLEKTDEQDFFSCDITTFGGNSGSPILDRQGNAVGILCSAHPDWMVSPTDDTVAQERVYKRSEIAKFPGCYRVSRTMFFIAQKINRIQLFTREEKIKIIEGKIKAIEVNDLATRTHMLELYEARKESPERYLKAARETCKKFKNLVPRVGFLVDLGFALGFPYSTSYRFSQQEIIQYRKQLSSMKNAYAREVEEHNKTVDSIKDHYEKMVSSEDYMSRNMLNMVVFGCTAQEAKDIDDLETQFEDNFDDAYSKAAVQALVQP